MINRVKRAVIVLLIISSVITTLLGCEQIKDSVDVRKHNPTNIVKVAVLLYRFDDEFIAEVRRSLEGIQGENKDKVLFTFYDSGGDQNKQNQILDEVIQHGTDLVMVNLVDIEASKNVIDKIKESNIPVIIFNREPTTLDPIRSYSKSLYIGTNAEQAGSMQGKIIINEWNNNKANIDKNDDNILQYIMLTGERDSREAILRTKFSVLKIKKSGITVEELALRVADWDRLSAKRAVESLLFKYGNRIEAIIANNDAMAGGAIEALQAAGYNKGDKSRMVVVIGVDATDEAQDLINKGFMSGTVLQDEYSLAEALYLVGMNLVSGKKPLEGTTYKFDETGVAIRLPYEEYNME